MKPSLRPDCVLMVPGFMSPAWMCRPMRYYLSRRMKHVEIWDHPHVFTDPQSTVTALATRLADAVRGQRAVGLVAHSYGDWVARSAIDLLLPSQKLLDALRMVSVCPVVAPVPPLRVLAAASLDVTPELQLMAHAESAGDCREAVRGIRHLVLWASWDPIAPRPHDWPPASSSQRILWGTHNSLMFQPNVWRIVAQTLQSG